jgi:nitric oxide reductase NorQ protein
MSSASSPPDDAQFSDEQETLSHLVDALLRKHGGQVDTTEVTLDASSYLANPDVSDLLREGEAGGIYEVRSGANGTDVITGVDPVGDRPDAIEEDYKEAFETDVADETPTELTDLNGIGDGLAANLRDNGYTSLADIATADTKELAAVPQITEGRADDIIKQAQAEIDTPVQWLEDALSPYRERGADASSRIVQMTATKQEVGTPVAIVDPSADPEDTHLHGYPVLEDVGHPDVPDVSGMVEPKTVDDPVTGEPVLERMAHILAKNNHGLLVVGPPGSGKNTRAKWLHGQTNRPYVQVDMTEDKRDLDFLGVKTVDEDGVVAHEDSELTRLAKYGGTFCVNEWNIGRESVRMLFQTILADRQLTVAPAREVISVHPEFRMMVTQNPITRENRGTNPVNRANLGRFRNVYCPYLAPSDEVDLLDSKHNRGRVKVKRDTLQDIVEAANKTRQESNGPTLSTRDLEAIVDDIDTGVEPLPAIRKRLHHLQLSQPYNDPDAAWDMISSVF